MGKKFGQKDKLPKKLGDTGDDPIADKDLDEKRKGKPDDDRGDADRRDKS